MLVAIGSDHGGFRLKKEITDYLTQKGIAFRDFGTNSSDSVDYPLIANEVAKAVACGECDKGIIVCGTGIGVSMAANKVKGIRAALCHDEFSAEMSRAHNDANVLTLGERVIGVGLALSIVAKWLSTEFDGGRHARRVAMLADLEK